MSIASLCYMLTCKHSGLYQRFIQGKVRQKARNAVSRPLALHVLVGRLTEMCVAGSQLCGHGRQRSRCGCLHVQYRGSGHRQGQHARSKGGSQPAVSSKYRTHTQHRTMTYHFAVCRRQRNFKSRPNMYKVSKTTDSKNGIEQFK